MGPDADAGPSPDAGVGPVPGAATGADVVFVMPLCPPTRNGDQPSSSKGTAGMVPKGNCAF